jgi:2,4-dienoyl-CoA reductase-like NADH-dependent reductase (Old Yellow Enzyme family)
MNVSYKKQIFEPLKLNNLTLKNRLLRSATWEGIAALDGSIDERIYTIYSFDHYKRIN